MALIKDSVKVAEVVKKVSPIETLRKIKVGDKRLVRQRDIDAAVVSSTVCKLNSTGCKYDLKAHIEGTVVKRLK